VTRRAKTKSLGVAFLFSLALAEACTDNSPSRLDQLRGSDAGADGSGKGGSVSTGGSSGTGATGTGGSSAAAGGAGGSDADPCLPECDDPAGCELTPEEELAAQFCRDYALHCPDQPSDVMMPGGPGTPVPAGPDAPSTATRPQLTEAEADDLYSIEKALRGGGVYSATYSGDPGAGGEGGGPSEPLGVRTVSYESEDDWDPRGPIENVTKIVPGLIVDPNGDPEADPRIRTTMQAAITKASNIAGCPRVFIKVMPGTYREKITVPAKTSTPPLTLYGVDRDPSKIVIVHGHSAAGEAVAEGCGTELTVHQSATFTNSLPQPFQARNFTVQNDYVAGTCLPEQPDKQTAVALLNQADKALFDNIRILGHRNALYVKSEAPNQVSRVYFRNCYVEGDEEIILGRGAAVIDQSRIHSLGDRISNGSIAAPSTRVDNPHGILIINSELTADARVSGVYLGHQWFEQVGAQDTGAIGKTIVRNSILGAHIRSGDVWEPTTRPTPKNPTPTEQVLYTSDDYYAPMTGLVPPEVFLAEFGNSGPGAAQDP
jgi:pectinesterase